MSITFTAEVTGVREFEKYTVLSLKYQPEGRKYPQYLDAKFPSDDVPSAENGDEVEVTFSYLPDARGWKSNKTNSDGENYINATVQLWKPTVKIASGAGAVPDMDDDSEIPFFMVPRDRRAFGRHQRYNEWSA